MSRDPKTCLPTIFVSFIGVAVYDRPGHVGDSDRAAGAVEIIAASAGRVDKCYEPRWRFTGADRKAGGQVFLFQGPFHLSMMLTKNQPVGK